MADNTSEVEKLCQDFRGLFASLRAEVGKVIVGHVDIVDNVLICLFCGGHVLLEGVPGLGKTLLVRTLSSALSDSWMTSPSSRTIRHFSRIPSTGRGTSYSNSSVKSVRGVMCLSGRPLASIGRSASSSP